MAEAGWSLFGDSDFQREVWFDWLHDLEIGDTSTEFVRVSSSTTAHKHQFFFLSDFFVVHVLLPYIAIGNTMALTNIWP